MIGKKLINGYTFTKRAMIVPENIYSICSGPLFSDSIYFKQILNRKFFMKKNKIEMYIFPIILRYFLFRERIMF